MKQTSAFCKVHWVLHPSAGARLLKLLPESDELDVPDEYEVVVRPFLVDAVSRVPVPVRVVQRLVEEPLSDTPSFVVVVARVSAQEEESASRSER